jgi:hypothetical protein
MLRDLEAMGLGATIHLEAAALDDEGYTHGLVSEPALRVFC